MITLGILPLVQWFPVDESQEETEEAPRLQYVKDEKDVNTAVREAEAFS